MFLKLVHIVDWLHNDAKMCLLNIRPDKILISQVGEEIEPYFYDLSMASDLSDPVSESKFELSQHVFDSFESNQRCHGMILPPEVQIALKSCSKNASENPNRKALIGSLDGEKIDVYMLGLVLHNLLSEAEKAFKQANLENVPQITN
jgi:hypothetical protein